MTQRLIGELIGNRYRLTFHLSEGGYGNVYKAVDTQLGDQVVAVKLLRSPPSEGDIEYYRKLQRRFMDEARVSALLGEHPGIVQVKSYGVHNQRPYLVMEYLNGKPWAGQGLDYILHREGAIDPQRVVPWAQQICAALHHAHCFRVDLGKHSIRGVVHRDIKPSNIFVQRNLEGQERVKLLDFGISKLLGDNTRGLTQAGYFLGTMCYASPEQMRGETLDARSDIYSLGVVLYELMTGQLPLMPDNDSLPGWYHVHNFEEPIPFYEHVLEHSIPEPLQQVVLGCLEKEPDNRPSSAQILESLLREAMELIEASNIATDIPFDSAPRRSPYPDPPTEDYIEDSTTAPVANPPPLADQASFKTEHQALFEQAVQLIQRREHRNAIHVLNQLIQEEPNEERYYLQRGIAHLRQGNWGLAQMDFQGALRLDPDSMEAQQGLRDALEQVGVDELSLSPTEEVNKPDPPDSSSFSLRHQIWIEVQWVMANGLSYGVGALAGLGIGSFWPAGDPTAATLFSTLVYGAAIGSVIGALVGLGQWLILRRYLGRVRSWVLVTALAHLVIYALGTTLILSTPVDLPLQSLIVLTSPLWGLSLGAWVNLWQLPRWLPSPWAWGWAGAGLLEMGLAAGVLSQILRVDPFDWTLIGLFLLTTRPLTGLILLRLLDRQKNLPSRD